MIRERGNTNYNYVTDNMSELQQTAEALENEKRKNAALSMASTGSTGIGQYQNSIVEWQLDLSKEFELIYHQLRGHIIKRDNEGNEFWTEPEDPDQKLLNEKGAQEVEKVVRNYLNKNVLLSNYDIKTINERVGQFAHRLRRFIYLNFEEFGLDTPYKQKHFEMLVMNIVDMVEAAYFRALNGEERQSLTTIRQIVQTESLDNRAGMSHPAQIQGRVGSKLNPANWFK